MNRLLGMVSVVVVLIAPLTLARGQPAAKPATVVKQPTRQVAFSPDESLLAIAFGEINQPGSLAVWQLATRKLLFVHRESVGIANVSFSPSGKLLAIGMFAPVAKLIVPATGAVIRELQGHESHVRSVAFVSNALLATGSYDGSLRLWETATGNQVAVLSQHEGGLRDIAASPDGKWLLTGCASPDARMWSIAERKQVAEFRPSTNICPTVAFSRDGEYFLTGRWDNLVRIQETSTHEIRAAFQAFARGFDLTPDNRTLIVCGDQPTIQLFPVALYAVPGELAKRIARLIAVWDDDDYRKRDEASRQLIELGMIAEPQLREAMKSTVAEVRIRARRARDAVLAPAPVNIDVGHQANVGAVRISPDGRYVASGDADGVVIVWRLNDRKVVAEFRLPEKVSE